MRTLTFPKNQIFQYELTGKFKAPSENWKHEIFYLSDYELFVITEGILYLNFGGEKFTVQSGEFLILPPPGWRQGFHSAYSAFYWLHLTTPPTTPFQLDEPLEADSAFTLPQQGTIPKLEKMVVLMKQLQDMVKSNYPIATINTMTTCVIAELYGQLSLNTPTIGRSQGQKQIYSDIIDYIQLNLSKNITVAEIANEFGYNRKYLSHLFVQITGIPLKQFILNQKMDAANFMLTDTNNEIARIAMDLGFSSSHNFSRTYKNMTGLTPSEYRNTYAKRLLYHK